MQNKDELIQILKQAEQDARSEQYQVFPENLQIIDVPTDDEGLISVLNYQVKEEPIRANSEDPYQSAKQILKLWIRETPGIQELFDNMYNVSSNFEDEGKDLKNTINAIVEYDEDEEGMPLGMRIEEIRDYLDREGFTIPNLLHIVNVTGDEKLTEYVEDLLEQNTGLIDEVDEHGGLIRSNVGILLDQQKYNASIGELAKINNGIAENRLSVLRQGYLDVLEGAGYTLEKDVLDQDLVRINLSDINKQYGEELFTEMAEVRRQIIDAAMSVTVFSNMKVVTDNKIKRLEQFVSAYLELETATQALSTGMATYQFGQQEEISHLASFVEIAGNLRKAAEIYQEQEDVVYHLAVMADDNMMQLKAGIERVFQLPRMPELPALMSGEVTSLLDYKAPEKLESGE